MPLLNENKNQAPREFMLKWYKVRRRVSDQFGKRPDLNAILFLIGLNEVGILREEFEKEEKQDLMHVAVCKLLSDEGFYVFEGKDDDGWPNYRATKKLPELDLKKQEELLKTKIVKYFEQNGLLD